jgi:hypothetical protein
MGSLQSLASAATLGGSIPLVSVFFFVPNN